MIKSYFKTKINLSSILKPSKTFRLLLMVLFVCLFGNVVSAQTNTWNGSSSNKWNIAANWSLNAVPTVAHDVVINTNAAISVDVNATINSLTISSSATVYFASSGGAKTITIDNTGSSIGSGSTLTLQGSTGTGTRSMSIAYTGTNQTMSIAGTLILTAVGDGTIYNATNSITTVTGIITNNDSAGGTPGVITSTATNLIFASVGTYKHELNGGTIPTATWNASSNCNITGVTSTLPGGSSQNFGNLTWNCTGQTGNSFPTTINIQGDLNIINTGSPTANECRPTDGSAHTVGGNYNHSGGIVRWARNIASSLTIAGNIKITGGECRLSNGIGVGTLKVGGNFEISGTGILTETNTGAGAVVFTKAGVQTFTSGGTISNIINFTVNSVSTLNVGTNLITGGGSFALNAGGTLITANAAGISTATATGSIQVTGTKTFPVTANYEFNGANQTLGNALTGANNLTLSGSGTKTLTGVPTVYGVLSMEGTATVSAAPTYGTAATLQYNTTTARTAGVEWITPFRATGGVIIANTGTITMNAPKVFNASVPLTINSGAKLATGSSVLTFGGNFINNGGTFTTGSSPIFITNTMATQSISGFTTTGPVSMTKTGGIATFTGNVNGAGLAAGTGGTLNLGTGFTHTFTGDFTSAAGALNLNSCTLYVGGNWISIGTFTAGTSTVNFNSTTPGKTISVVGSGGFNNLTFNGVGGGWAITSDLDVANTLTVTNGDVSMSGTLTVAGATAASLAVSAPGTLTFENNASLIQSGYAGANSGNITYKRQTTIATKFDYTYWSSPVANQQLTVAFPNTVSDKFYSFDAAIGNWKQEANSMSVGTGYIVRYLTLGVSEASFKGVPNNGTVTTPIGATGTYNLIGNPYPSAIDADLFLTNTNNNTVLIGTLYFWTHNTPRTNGAYTSGDYAVYNLSGGVGTGTGTKSTNSGGNNNAPNGKIAAGQSFFVQSNAAGTATFNNSMRMPGSNSKFFKFNNTKAKSANALEKHRIWLNLSNSQGAFKQTLVGYITGATNGYDSSYDGESFDGNPYVDFYSVNQNKNLVIQGRALPFEVTDTVPLGYRTTIEGTFTINIDQADGLLAGQAVFIEDKLNNTVFDLKSGDYTFTTVKGTFNDRFVLRYTNKTLGTKDFIIQENQVLVSNINKQIKINSDVETIDKVQVYDLLGKQIYQKTNVNSNELSIPNLVSSHQVLVVKTILQNGQTVTKKIIY